MPQLPVNTTVRSQHNTMAYLFHTFTPQISFTLPRSNCAHQAPWSLAPVWHMLLLPPVTPSMQVAADVAGARVLDIDASLKLKAAPLES